MILRRLITLILLLCLPVSGQAQWFSSNSSNDDFLPVLEAFQPSAWHDGETLYVGVEVTPEHYLYRHQLAAESDGVNLGKPWLPEGEFTSDEFLGDVYVFRDDVVIEFPIEEGASGLVPLIFTFQGCADAGLCYPPERVSLEAPEREAPAAFAALVGGNGSATTGTSDNGPTLGISGPMSEDGRFSALMNQSSLPLILGLFFLAGLGLTFTPCVLPMIPILSSIIVGQNPGRPRAFALSASYVGGMSLTYAAVGVLMGLFGAGLNLQAHLQSAPVLIAFAVLFAVFAMAMFGTFTLRLSPAFGSRIDAWQTRAQRSGPAGLALAGALSVLVVSPCVSAPLAGALVFISTTGDAILGGAALLALGLGMGVPLLIVGTFGTSLLPRTGAWMNGIKIAFGIMLLGVAIWLIERLLAPSVALLLWAALAIGSALALGALTVNQPAGWPRIRQTAGVLLLAWGLALVLGASAGGQDPLRPLAGIVGNAATDTTADSEITTVTNMADFETALARASQADRPAFVHVTADWCISCKVMERQVYPVPEVAQRLSAFARIYLDVTDTNEASSALLNHFDLFGPPSLLFFNERQELRQARIQGEVRAPALANHLESVLEWLNTQRS